MLRKCEREQQWERDINGHVTLWSVKAKVQRLHRKERDELVWRSQSFKENVNSGLDFAELFLRYEQFLDLVFFWGVEVGDGK